MQILAVLLLAGSLAGAQTVAADACPNVICKIIARGRLAEMQWPDFADFRTRLTAFYAPAYAPAWLSDNKPTANALAMIEILKAAELKGLKPEDYDAGLWDERVAHLDRFQFDVELTVCLMRYLADLHFGKDNPGFYHLDPKNQDFDIPVFLRTKLMQCADPKALLTKEVEPPFESYQLTEKVLADYVAMAREPEVKLSDLTATVEPGSAYPEASLLAQRLRQLRDLPAPPAASETSQIYGDALVEAVKHFQARHGLEPDGRLGKATMEALNIPLSQRVLQLRLALERWRWLPHSFAHPPIMVNIPEFTLRTLNKAFETDLEMKIIVGSAYENETPVFQANLAYITFRPYWNVPTSILENEMAPKLAADRDYLAVHRYQVVNAADHVIPIPDGLTDLVLKRILAGRYRIRQMPGPDCALGLIRFGIPNEHNVYLHDTPKQTLFAKSRRDFSHGCVRVERPAQLAEWCLRDTGRWPQNRIRAAMHGVRTFQVNLKKPIPVLLIYETGIVERNGEVHFTLDIYHQDALLENRLARGYPSRNTSEH